MGGAAAMILLYRALWAPSVGRIIDTSLRYTIDKTSREVLFLPLPTELKYRAKPFIDVTMDRFAKGVGAVVMLLCIKDWGLGLDWQQLSYVSGVLVGAVGLHGDRGAPRVPPLVPAEHRATDRRAVERAAERSRSVVGRDAGQRAGASRAATRALRDRSARRDGQAPTRHTAAAVARQRGGSRPGAASRRVGRPGAGRSLAAGSRARA